MNTNKLGPLKDILIYWKAGFQEPVQYAKQIFGLDLFDIWLPMQLSLSLMLRWKHWEMDHVRYHVVKLT